MTVITWLRVLANPDSKIHRGNMGPTWGRQDPGGTHVGPMNFAIWEVFPIKLLKVLENVLFYMLTHWPMEDLKEILDKQFSS